MPKTLSQEQADFFARENYLAPVPAIAPERAASVLAELDAFAARTGEDPVEVFKDKPHLLLKSLSDVARDPHVLDAVEDVLGPDILLIEAGFFWKLGGDKQYAAWHQDATYLRMEPPLCVTAWIALTDSKIDNGCLRVIPGTQHSELPLHMIDDPDNYLRMNREISVPLAAESAVNLELELGEMSLHGRLVHGSRPNLSDRRRVGYAVMYIPPHVTLNAGTMSSATLVRGEDRYGHFEPEPEPRYDWDPVTVAWYEKQSGQGMTGTYRWD
ncbi:MAG: phytanoyl-CoA dioxygenase family protein [Proteobacteria bacterium]|nr:phytanoyl-CoA dioxygenase family protein [Pseudomonadota bacterium]